MIIDKNNSKIPDVLPAVMQMTRTGHLSYMDYHGRGFVGAIQVVFLVGHIAGFFV